MPFTPSARIRAFTSFCRVGLEAFLGGYSVVVKDAMPYATIRGNHAFRLLLS